MNLALLALLLCLGGCASSSRSNLREGQWWSYATRPGEEKSTLIIRKIERWPDIGEVIHVQVLGTFLKTPPGSEHLSTSVLYFAIEGSYLRSSLKDKVDVVMPDVPWLRIYEAWTKNRSPKHDGVYKMPVRDCVALMDELINRKEDRANKPLQPTPGSVTPRATESVPK